MTAFQVYDVFTDSAFGGNQLAVIPDATGLPEAALQKIAREFNFSESTFVFPPDNPGHTARVRIFTPTREIPFAGHPTVGTAVALAAKGPDLVLELGVGPIVARVAGRTAEFTTSAPLERLANPDPGLVAACLSLPPGAIRTTTHLPVQASLGLPFVIAELDSRASLSACRPVTDLMRQGAERYPAGLDFSVFVYARAEGIIHARMFAPLDNIPEDPATGSACATLAALLTEETGAAQSLMIHQGDEMGRPSRIAASTRAKHPVPVTIGGSAVLTMEGLLHV